MSSTDKGHERAAWASGYWPLSKQTLHTRWGHGGPLVEISYSLTVKLRSRDLQQLTQGPKGRAKPRSWLRRPGLWSPLCLRWTVHAHVCLSPRDVAGVHPSWPPGTQFPLSDLHLTCPKHLVSLTLFLRWWLSPQYKPSIQRKWTKTNSKAGMGWLFCPLGGSINKELTIWSVNLNRQQEKPFMAYFENTFV